MPIKSIVSLMPAAVVPAGSVAIEIDVTGLALTPEYTGIPGTYSIIDPVALATPPRSYVQHKHRGFNFIGFIIKGSAYSEYYIL